MKSFPRHFFAGDRVRAFRSELGQSQGRLAAELGISLSYLSQIESGDRPITPRVLAQLAARYPTRWTSFDISEESALLARLLDACSSENVGDSVVEPSEVQRLARQHPGAARRLASLHEALLHSQEQLRALDDHVQSNVAREPQPWEAVRDWFHVRQNYIDRIDRLTEQHAEQLSSGNRLAELQGKLWARFGVAVTPQSDATGELRSFDAKARVLHFDPAQPSETTLFSLAYQYARLEFAEMISEVADQGMESATGRTLLTAGLTNYAAGALLMPYVAFRQAARDCRHDIDLLRQRFGTSFEQACHRLSTLQRPGAEGIPMFFCRVDMAGNITKRHSATNLQFARYGGACPLWVVHEAVAIPDRILVQLAETPDGVRYVCMARGLVKPSGSFSRQPRRYAVALGCEERHATEFIYADVVRTGGRATPIGTSCRICPRRECDQRAYPPAAADIRVDPDRRTLIPYEIP